MSTLTRMLVLLSAASGMTVQAMGARIASTPHNLSVSGPGRVRAQSEARICVFCHTPHNAKSGTPLWNREMSGAVYKIYSSTTLDAKPGQPTGASKMCLSCHDGTVAIGKVRSLSTPIPLTGTSGTMPPGPKLA